jgi:hypothetical protein
MSENQLIPADISGTTDLDAFKDAVSGGDDYLGRFQLFGSKSDACAEGKIGIGHYGYVKDQNIDDLGEEIDAVICTWRSKAVDNSGDQLVINYDAGSETYNEIKKKSFIRDSNCMFGTEFLLWIPSAGVFGTYHMNSKTARRESKKMAPLIGKAATFRAILIDPPKSKFKWHGPVVTPCSAQLTIPELDVLKAEIEKFKNPPESDVEVVADDNNERSR